MHVAKQSYAFAGKESPTSAATIPRQQSGTRSRMLFLRRTFSELFICRQWQMLFELTQQHHQGLFEAEGLQTA